MVYLNRPAFLRTLNSLRVSRTPYLGELWATDAKSLCLRRVFHQTALTQGYP